MRISGVAKCLWEMFLPVWAGACGESGKMMPRLATDFDGIHKKVLKTRRKNVIVRV